jgi:hypothetical protein
VITDPQNDFLSPKVQPGCSRRKCDKNHTVENLEQLFKVAKNNYSFVSPHYYFKHDHNWQIEGSLEALMHKINMFDRTGVLTTVGLKTQVLIG